MIYDAFKSKEYEHKITLDQWISALSGPQAQSENPGPEMTAQDPVEELNQRDGDSNDDNQKSMPSPQKNSLKKKKVSGGSPSKSGSKKMR